MTRGRLVPYLALTAALSCGDPVHDEAVKALGAEAPGVPEGPLHRPGQPCLLCHGGEGPADRTFSFAGTVFRSPSGGEAVPSARLRLVDRDRLSFTVDTNCSGNFFVTEEDFTPRFPAVVAVSTSSTVVMRTLMNRSGSCNECHTLPPGSGSPGLVWAAPTTTKQCAAAEP